MLRGELRLDQAPSPDGYLPAGEPRGGQADETFHQLLGQVSDLTNEQLIIFIGQSERSTWAVSASASRTRVDVRRRLVCQYAERAKVPFEG